MAITAGDAVVKITGDTKGLDQSLDSATKNVKTSAEKMQKSLKVAGAAFTAVGAAGLMMVSSAKKMNASLGVTALNLGVTTGEMRNLALETTNVTFPLSEVTTTFDLLARAGVKDTEVLKSVATAFDTLGDATGNTATQVTEKMVPAMKTFGLSAEEVANQTDMMTYLIRNTTVSMDNFGSVIGYITPEVVAMGLTLEDTVALMALMEERGMSGEVATRAFRTAITEATKEQIPLNEALGVTTEEMDAYKEKLDGATGMTEEYAKEANKQYGLMDKIKQKFSEMTLVAGSFLEPLEPILAAMAALGPVIMILSTSIVQATLKWIAHTVALVATKVATYAATAALWAYNAALAANPIGLVIVAVMALAAALIALISYWDKVVSFFRGGADEIKEETDNMNQWISDQAEELTAKMRTELEKRRDDELAEIDRMRGVAEQYKEDEIARLREKYGSFEELDSKYTDSRTDRLRKYFDELRDSLAKELNEARTAHNEKMQLLDEEYAAKLRTLDAATQETVAGLQDEIDAIGDQMDEESRLQLERDRAERLAELQRAVEQAETDEERAEAVKRLNDYILQVEEERHRESQRAEQDRLREEIDAALEAADVERDILEAELEEKKTHEEEMLAETESRIEKEQAGLDAAFKRRLQKLKDQLEAKIETEEASLQATQERLDKEEDALRRYYRDALEQERLYLEALRIMREEYEEYGAPVYHSGESWWRDLLPWQHGGVIKEPTLLTSMRTGMPYAIAGEAGPERISPMGGGAASSNINNTFNIAELVVREEADVQRIALELYTMQQRSARLAGV